MSNTKGVEIKFRDRSIQMSERQMDVRDVFIQKMHDLFSITVGGLMKDKKTHCTLYYAYDLREGDEITIERKELEQSSDSITMPDSYVPGKEPPDEAHRQCRLTWYRELEAKLKEKGLI
jgi:hypothetical protein